MARPRLLFVSPRFLFPLDEGGKIRTTGILRAMKGGAFHITLASPAPAAQAMFAAEIASVADRFVSWPTPRTGSLRRLLAVAGKDPVSTAGDRSAAGRRIIASELARRPEILVADFPHAAVLLPQALPASSVMFTHNVEAEILERHASVARGWRRLVWRREAAKMRRFEGDVLRRFSAVIAVSERDGVALSARYSLPKVARIDTGVDLDFYPFHAPREDAGTVVFSGAMDSRSNIDGISFLLREVWPIVSHAMPSARMKVVGRNPPADLVQEAAAHGPNWVFTGRVEDIRPHLAAGDVAAIPLRVGSGTRLKAFEAMATGLPVVSTTLGVEGLGLLPSTHYEAADTAADFAAALMGLLANATRRRQLADTGRRLLEEKYGWQEIARQFEAICLSALQPAG